jgi:hypothetical protein
MTVLETVRDLLRFKSYTTIPEIAKISGMKQADVLKIINENGKYVFRERKNGHIVKIDTHTPLREKLWASGKYYRKESYGAWSYEGDQLKFNGHDELKNEMQETIWQGGLGDCYQKTLVFDTPDNRQKLHDVGLSDWENVVIDDQLWKETK